MKKRVLFIILPVIAALLCSACTLQLQIRFVDKAGNDVSFSMPAKESANTVPAASTAATETAQEENTAQTENTAQADTNTESTYSTTAPDVLPSTSAAPPIPVSKEEILLLYKSAVARVRNGEAGYAKKTWESASAKKVTGIEAIDSFITREVEKRATSEADAETVFFEKGSDDAKRMFPDCTLSDASKIVSASCVLSGDNYKIQIVMQDEDTPESIKNSMIGNITDIILFKDEIDRNLTDTLPAVKNYQYNLLYKAFEVTCEITTDGRFIELQHHAVGDVHISTVQILFVTLKDKEASITMDALFTDFNY